MAILTLSDVQIAIAQYDLSGWSNRVQLTHGAEMLDDTVFGPTPTRSNKAGLRTVSLREEGFWDSVSAAAPDPVLFAKVGENGALFTVTPDGWSAAGAISYAGLLDVATFEIGAQIGELFKFTADGQGAGALVRGTLMTTDASQAATYAATKRQLGALSAAQSMIAALHVLAFNGTSLDVVVRSDANETAGGETTRGTFTQATAITSERIVIAGAITDAWWGANLTFVGTSFTAVLTLGIL